MDSATHYLLGWGRVHIETDDEAQASVVRTLSWRLAGALSSRQDDTVRLERARQLRRRIENLCDGQLVEIRDPNGSPIQ